MKNLWMIFINIAKGMKLKNKAYFDDIIILGKEEFLETDLDHNSKSRCDKGK